MAKPSVSQKASQFLAQIGTAGGPVGAMTAPNLVAFGAGDIQRQLVMGNTDYYQAVRMEGANPAVGNPNQPSAMPNNLQANYLALNLPGSPLPQYGLLLPRYLKSAEMIQKQMGLQAEQRLFASMMPMTGQLPISPMQAAAGAAQQLQNQKAKQNRGRR